MIGAVFAIVITIIALIGMFIAYRAGKSDGYDLGASATIEEFERILQDAESTFNNN